MTDPSEAATVLAESAQMEETETLEQHPQNPRQGDVGAIVESIRANGFYCLAPETLVLCADLVWRKLGELMVGDEVIGFDEELDKRQRFRRATVEATDRRTLDCYEVETALGVTVASADHLWLVTRHRREWVRTADLRRDDQIVSFGAPWHVDTSHGGGYLAGLFDGEGHLSERRVAMSQLPGAVLDEAIELLDRRGYTFDVRKHPDSGVAMVRLLGGRHEALRFLGSIRPRRLLAKAEQIWDGLLTWSRSGNHEPVVGLRRVGPREVVAIGTSTRTLIADGLLSHNSPVIAQRSTRQVLAGNHRLLAARELGMTEIPVVWVDVDDERALRILLADNRTSDLGYYDDGALAALLTDLAQQTDDALAGTAWDGNELDRLLADLSTEMDPPKYAGLSHDERKAVQYDVSTVRQIILVLDVPTFERALRVLAEIRRQDGRESNTEVIVGLLEDWAEAHDFTSEPPPEQ